MCTDIGALVGNYKFPVDITISSLYHDYYYGADVVDNTSNNNRHTGIATGTDRDTAGGTAESRQDGKLPAIENSGNRTSSNSAGNHMKNNHSSGNNRSHTGNDLEQPSQLTVLSTEKPEPRGIAEGEGEGAYVHSSEQFLLHIVQVLNLIEIVCSNNIQKKYISEGLSNNCVVSCARITGKIICL